MTQQFLNENLKPYIALTREEKHILLDAAIDKQVEFYCGGAWMEWDSIINAENGIYRTKPKECKKLDITWQVIAGNWKYAAMDKNLDVYLFENSPVWNKTYWVETSNNGRVSDITEVFTLDTTGIIAEHSLTQRPEGA